MISSWQRIDIYRQKDLILHTITIHKPACKTLNYPLLPLRNAFSCHKKYLNKYCETVLFPGILSKITKKNDFDKNYEEYAEINLYQVFSKIVREHCIPIGLVSKTEY